MGLAPLEVDTIGRLTREVAGLHAQARPLGSPAHDHLLGCGIDLMVELNEPTPDKLDLSPRTSGRRPMAMAMHLFDVLPADPPTAETTLIQIARCKSLAP